MNSQLSNALNRIKEWHTQNQPQNLKYLQPGLDKTEIDKLVHNLPFPINSELYELYQWHNGSSLSDDESEGAWVFKNYWSFRPLEFVVASYQEMLRKKQSLLELGTNPSRIEPFLENFSRINIFYTIDYFEQGSIWINEKLPFCPVILCNLEEELSIIDKYSSLTNMMLTIAECYETGIYNHNEYHFCSRYYEPEKFFWHKYNAELIEFALFSLLSTSFSNLVWGYIVYELVYLKDARAIELLIKWLDNLIHSTVDIDFDDPNTSWRFFIYDQKLLYKDENNYDYLYLESGLPKILGEMFDIRAVPVLIATLENDNLDKLYYRSRICAAYALGQLKDQRATIALMEILKDEREDVREMAAWALGEIGDTRAIDALIKAGQDSDEEVRLAVTSALAKLGSG